jgi:Domain of unknown function (DUF4340)
MNYRTTIILLGLVAAVGAYVIYTNNRPTSSTELQQINPTKLVDFPSSEVKKVVIAPVGGRRLVLERTPQTGSPPVVGPATSDWKISEPIDAPADSMKVSDLIDAITAATSTAQVSGATGSADYGLDNPQFIVAVDTPQKTVTIDIGRLEKAGNELYVQVEGQDAVQVIDGDILDKLNTSADKLRLARLITADASGVSWVSISRTSDAVTLQKTAGQWQLSVFGSPTSRSAEASVVGDVISTLNNAQAAGFAGPDDNLSLLIGQPQASVTVANAPPTTQPSPQWETIEFGAPDSLVGQNVWVRITPAGIVAKIPKETMESILKPSLDFRNRTIVDIAAANVTQVQIIKTSPATTQPTKRPASVQQIVLTRRVDKAQIGPPLPSTHPSSQPTTLPAPKSKWLVRQGQMTSPADADDTKTDAVAAAFNPLRADKCLANSPLLSSHDTRYVVTITTAKGSSELVLSDPGEASGDPIVGTFDGDAFTVPRTVIQALDVDFTKTTTP